MLNNKLSVAMVLLVTGSVAFARGSTINDHEPGFIIGVEGGMAWVDEGSGPKDYINYYYDHFSDPRSKDINKGKFGGRLFIGYSFNPYFTLEGGYTLYPSNKYTASDIYPGATFTKTIKTDFFTVDLMLKGILHLERLTTKLTGWHLDAKFGPVITGMKVTVDDFKTNLTAVTLGYGLGIGYNFTDNLSMDLTWSGIYSSKKIDFVRDSSGKPDLVHYRKNGMNESYPTANLLALGITYKF